MRHAPAAPRDESSSSRAAASGDNSTVVLHHCSNSPVTSEVKIPFPVMIPSLLYERDAANPRLMRFREARSVRVHKDYLLQLCTTDFRVLARSVEHFASKIRHCIFIFLLDPSGSEQPMSGYSHDSDVPAHIRGFRISSSSCSSGPDLEEERDRSIVHAAWSQFQRSSRCQHSVDERVEAVSQHPHPLLAGEAAQGLKTLVDVHVHSTVGCYAYSSVEQEGGPLLAGRLVFSNAFHVFCGGVQVPMLMPVCELASPSERCWCLGSLRARHRCLSARALGGTAPVIIMPCGWYRRNLVGAREHSVRFYRDKCILLVCSGITGDVNDRISRVFPFSEAQPALPLSRADRKGLPFSAYKHGGGDNYSDEEECAHDDVVPTPVLALSQAFRWKQELDRHPLSKAVLEM